MKGNCPYKSCKFPHLAFDMQPPEGPPPGMLKRDVLVNNPKALPASKQVQFQAARWYRFCCLCPRLSSIWWTTPALSSCLPALLLLLLLKAPSAPCVACSLIHPSIRQPTNYPTNKLMKSS